MHVDDWFGKADAEGHVADGGAWREEEVGEADDDDFGVIGEGGVGELFEGETRAGFCVVGGDDFHVS